CAVPLYSAPVHIAVFSFNATTTTEIYTLSLHDALPISGRAGRGVVRTGAGRPLRRLSRAGGRDDGAGRNGRREQPRPGRRPGVGDRKSTRLNSSHVKISYAVFCLKKKKQQLTYTNS